MDVVSQLARAATGGRARSSRPPGPERLEDISRAVSEGSYRVPADRVAEALIASLAAGRSERRG